MADLSLLNDSACANKLHTLRGFEPNQHRAYNNTSEYEDKHRNPGFQTIWDKSRRVVAKIEWHTGEPAK